MHTRLGPKDFSRSDDVVLLLTNQNQAFNSTVVESTAPRVNNQTFGFLGSSLLMFIAHVYTQIN